MSYLDHFHFDNIPFPVNGKCNYFYPHKKQIKIVSELSNILRFYSGVFVIKGSDGVGKTTVVNKLIDKIKHNDYVILINANDKTDIIKTVAKHLELQKNNLEDVFDALNLIYSEGKNIILIIDDAENLTKEQLINLNSFMHTLKYLRIVFSGKKEFYKHIKRNNIIEIKNHIVKKYKLKYLSFFNAVSYISNISTSCLSLSQYKKVITGIPLFLIAFVSNRNINNINIITTESLKNSFDRGQDKARIKDVFKSIKTHPEIVKLNIYLKFQKIFLYALLILSVYFAAKISLDRYDFMKNMEIKESILQQEMEIKNI